MFSANGDEEENRARQNFLYFSAMCRARESTVTMKSLFLID